MVKLNNLRRLILRKAVTGELVVQQENESEVLQIGPELDEKEMPFHLPNKWKFVQLNAIGEIGGGGTPASKVAEYWSDPSVIWITASDLHALNSVYIVKGARCISKSGLKNCKAKLFPSGSLIFTTTGDNIGDLAISTQEFCVNDSCTVFVPFCNYVEVKWIYYALLDANKEIKELASGTTTPRLSKEDFRKLWIPLPPLEEQQRIIAKIDDLFNHVGIVENMCLELAGSQTQHLHDLILDLALSGRLIGQSSERSSNSSMTNTSSGAVHFNLPKDWQWTRLGNIVDITRTGYKSSAKDDGNVKLLRITDIASGYINWASVPFSYVDKSKMPCLELHVNDFVIARSGTTLGKSCLITKLDDRYPCVFSVSLIKVSIKHNSRIDIGFLKLFFESPMYWQGIRSLERGTAVSNITSEQLGNMLIPLPPLPEQYMIVAKCENLLSRINKIRALGELINI